MSEIWYDIRLKIEVFCFNHTLIWLCIGHMGNYDYTLNGFICESGYEKMFAHYAIPNLVFKTFQAAELSSIN